MIGFGGFTREINQSAYMCINKVAAVKLESGVEKQQTFLALVSSKKASHESA